MLNYHRLDEPKILAQPHYLQRGRPNTEANHHSFHILATLVENSLIVAIHRQQVGRFILATNSLDSQKWTECEILREYKGQQSTE